MTVSKEQYFWVLQAPSLAGSCCHMRLRPAAASARPQALAR